jgi:hypothetical protein
MRLSPLLDAQGRRVVRFGGQDAWLQRARRGYIVNFEWAPDPDNRKRTDACIVIISETGTDRGSWMITRRGIMRFCDAHNKPTLYAFQQARQALPLLGRSTIDLEVKTLVDVVMDSVDDLVLMPATPPAVRQDLQRAPMWEIIRRDLDRKVVAEDEA